MLHIARRGTNSVGLHFVAYRAKYFARGWISKIEMLNNGPQKLSMYFGTTLAARTTNGVFTRDNFTAQALEQMNAAIDPNAIEHRIPDNFKTGLFYFSGAIPDIYIESRESENEELPTDRQNYYMEQTWVQVLRRKDNATGNSDMDYEPQPCIRLYNLLSGDPSSTVLETCAL